MSDLSKQIEGLAEHTPARLTLARAGVSPSSAERLRFAHDHSLARDAVRRELDAAALSQELQNAGIGSSLVRSQVGTLADHLQRPDLGRRLRAEDRVALGAPTDAAVVVADGLSSGAVERYAVRMLRALGGVERITLVRFGRVAIGDEIGECLEARLAIVLIGERPGLSASESMGVYVTYQPKVGKTDAERICLSNIRDRGNPPENAAIQLREIIAKAILQGKTGV